MHKYALRRLIQIVPTIILVSFVIFVIMRIAPGDVASLVATGGNAEDISQVPREQIEAIRTHLGLNDPLHIQYARWMAGMVTLDWGSSLLTDRSVWGEFSRKLPVTIELGVVAVTFSLVIGIPMGVVSALKQDTLLDYVVRVFTLGGLSIPGFWIGSMVLMGGLYFFTWSPPLGFTSFFSDPLTNLKQMAWPAIIVGYSTSALKARITRSSMLEVLRQDYIRTAHAKGLVGSVVLYRHALKNALLPVVTIIGISFAVIISGSVIMEQIFTLPGVGLYLVEGMRHLDYAVVQPLVVFFAVWVMVVNLLVDLAYGWLDPRIRYT